MIKWIEGAKESIVVAGDQGLENSLTQLNIVVEDLGAVYVRSRANQLYFPWNLSFDRQNNLYVADYYNH